jgi:chorismate mutase
MARGGCGVLAALMLLLIAAGPAAADPDSRLVPLVDAAAQRLQTADPVAAVKFHTQTAVHDAQRAQEVLDAVTADATSRHIDPNFVRTVFEDQIDATEAVEYARLSQWLLEAASAPLTPPDLAASRAAIDALNQTMVEEIARQWDLLHAPQCPADLGRAVEVVAESRKLDDVYRRALAFATHSSCGQSVTSRASPEQSSSPGCGSAS